MPWNDKFECMPVEELQRFQLEKLQETISWVYQKVPFYQKKLDEMGIRAEDIRSTADMARLPLTVKNDLRDHYPFGLCAVPMAEVCRVHASSGTTGKPITGPYTADDLAQWTECMARNLWAAGVRSGRCGPECLRLRSFYRRPGLPPGTRTHRLRRGADQFRTDGTADHPDEGFRTDVLCGTPSYALTIAERAEEMNIDIRSLPLRVGVFGAEPWSDSMRARNRGTHGDQGHGGLRADRNRGTGRII